MDLLTKPGPCKPAPLPVPRGGWNIVANSAYQSVFGLTVLAGCVLPAALVSRAYGPAVWVMIVDAVLGLAGICVFLITVKYTDATVLIARAGAGEEMTVNGDRVTFDRVTPMFRLLGYSVLHCERDLTPNTRRPLQRFGRSTKYYTVIVIDDSRRRTTRT